MQTLFNNTNLKKKTHISFHIKYNTIIKRNLASMNALRHQMHKMSYVQSRTYAKHCIFTPKATTSSQEGLQNNPAVTLHRKNGSKVIQHPEHTQKKCTEKDCETYVCPDLCKEPATEEVSVGILSHTEEGENGYYLVSETDLDGFKREQTFRKFETPHKTTGESVDPSRDEQRTEKLQKWLTEDDD
jgi:hypothetical protein